MKLYREIHCQSFVPQHETKLLIL